MIRLTPPIRSTVPERRILRATKTALNPRIKLTVRGINRGRGEAASETALSPAPRTAPVLAGLAAVPPKKQSQEGIRGSTQGDKNENTPAAKARTIDRLTILEIYPILPFPAILRV
jgi:hypothetical protein